MATSTYIPIASITLGSSASSVTFSSIPQDYRDLVLVVNCRPTTSIKDLVMQFNGDASNGTRVAMFGNDSSAGSNQSSNIVAQFNNAGVSEVGISQIMDYSATDKHKTALVRANSATGNAVNAQAARWASTSAITSINLAYSTDIQAGGTFALYGIEA